MYEIELIDSGDIFELNEQSVIKVTYSSFNLSKIDRNNTDKSNSFEIPLTPKNIKILKGLGTPSNVSNKPYIYNGVNLRYKGDIIIKRGTIVFQEINFNKDTIKANIIDRDASFYALIRDLSLEDSFKDEDIIINLPLDIDRYIRGTHKHSDKIKVPLTISSDNSITSYPKNTFDEEELYKKLPDNYDVEKLMISDDVEPTFNYDLTYLDVFFNLDYIVKTICKSVGFSAVIDEYIKEDLDDLVIKSKHIKRKNVVDDKTYEFNKDDTLYHISKYMPDISAGEILKDFVVRFNLNIVIDYESKSVIFENWDKVIQNTLRVDDFTSYAKVKEKEVYSLRDFGIYNKLLFNNWDEATVELEENSTDDRLASSFTTVYQKGKTANDYSGTFILNNSNIELEKVFFNSKINAPKLSNWSNEVLGYQFREYAIENSFRKYYNVFGKIKLGDTLYNLMNTSNQSSSVYKNKALGESAPHIYSIKALNKPHRYNVIRSYDTTFMDVAWSNSLIDPNKLYEEQGTYKPLMSDEYVVKGADGRFYLGDYAIDLGALELKYNRDLDPKFNRTNVSNSTPPYYMFAPYKSLSNYSSIKPDNGIFMDMRINEGEFLSWTYINVDYSINETENSNEDLESFYDSISFSPSIADSSYNFFNIESEFNLTDTSYILTTDKLGFKYYLDKYHIHSRGLYSNLTIQDWQCIMPPSKVKSFKFDRLVYLDQEQAYFYVNEIKEYDATTGIATLNVMKVDYSQLNKTIEAFYNEEGLYTVVLFIDYNDYIDLEDNRRLYRAYENIYDDSIVDYLKDATKLSKEGIEYILRYVDGKTYIEVTIDEEGEVIDPVDNIDIIITYPYNNVEITSQTLPQGILMQSTVLNGVAPFTYRWELRNSDGVLIYNDYGQSNHPITFYEYGWYSVTVTVTDSNNHTSTDTVNFRIKEHLTD